MFYHHDHLFFHARRRIRPNESKITAVKGREGVPPNFIKVYAS